jgi:hypothetical protein
LKNKSPFSTISIETKVCARSIRNIYIDLNNGMKNWISKNIFDTEFVFQRIQSVEIDEAYVHWSYNNNSPELLLDPVDNEGDWLLGMISRDRTKMWVYPIKDRTKENLICPILDVTEKETTLHTDALSTYDLLDKDYIHYVINKKQEGFSHVHGPTGVLKSVNHCECVWKHLRELARDRHMNNPKDVVFICIEYMFRFYHHSIYEVVQV